MSTTQEQDLFDLLDVEDFKNRIVCGYNEGSAELGLPADVSVARSIIAPGTAALRDFSYIAPDIPVLNSANCVGCMECVTECPDTAILAKVVPQGEYEQRRDSIADPAERAQFEGHFNRTRKYYDAVEKKGDEPGMFGIFIDPTKCKGCAECVEVCGEHDALAMEAKEDRGLEWYRTGWRHFQELPETPERYISERVLTDMMLSTEAVSTFTGGAGSCMGCGEVTALRMMLAATAFVHGKDNIGLVAATGCNTVYASTYPYNPYTVPWMNSLFENAATTAAGVRLRWDQMGWGHKKIWALGGDGGMIDIGFQALSRLLASGMNVNVMILDTQVYSNTGGQTSTASFFGQEAKLSAHGSARGGKVERRKEAAQIAMMHPNVFVAQTTAAIPNHFYRAIVAANEYDGPSVIIVYTTCQPEHGVGDSMSSHQAKLAVESRAFPLLIHDPREGESLAERISLKGNPAVKEDWAKDPKTGEDFTFVDFARTEGRFRKHFGKDGAADDAIRFGAEQRLQNWRQLQELAGLR